MRINLFKTFVKVVDTQNLSRVAEELDISQPAVSKQIQTLEEMYGILLLERAGRRLKPTEAGEALYHCAKEILRAVDKADKTMEDIADSRKGRLLLGASTIPGQYILPTVIKAYKHHFPYVIVSMEIGDTEDILNKVAEKELDVGIVGAWISNRRLEHFEWLEDELLLVVPAAHHLVKASRVSLKDLAQEQWIFREKGSGTRLKVEELLREIGLKKEELNVLAEVGSTEAVLSSVETGMGISLVSAWAARRAENSGKIRSVKVEGVNLKRNFYVVFPRQKHRRKTVETFLEFLKNAEEDQVLAH